MKKLILISAIALSLGTFCVYGEESATLSKLAASPVSLNIPVQFIGDALNEFAAQSGLQVVFYAQLVEGIQSKALVGDFVSKDKALKNMLLGTGLSHEYINERTVAIQKIKDIENKPDKKDSPEAIQPTSTNSREAKGFIPKKIEEEEKIDITEALDIVVVTGSNLITEPSSLSRQVDIFEIEEIRQMGAHDLDTFFRLLPQNINSASRVGVGTGGDNQFGTTQNLYGASSINLRGIGDGTTLILVDGKRVAGGGVFGEAVNINNFPLSMIERVEIIYDGASAIYGSDAIGGVVNIITRKDYQGTVVDINYSRPSQGGTTRTQIDLGHTFSWDNSRLTLGLSSQFESDLDGSERNIAFGTDFPSVPYGSPGNIRSSGIVFDANTGQIVQIPLFYIDPATGERINSQVAEEICFPDGQGGEFCFTQYTWIADLGVDVNALTPIFEAQLPQGFTGVLTLDDIQDFDPTSAGLSGIRDITLIPKNEALNYRANYAYDFSNDMHFNINTSYNQSESDYSFRNTDFVATIFPQPFSPFSVAVGLFSSLDFLPVSTQHTENKNLNLSATIDGAISPTWNWELSYSLSDSQTESLRMNTINSISINALVLGQFSDQSASLYNPFAHLFGFSSQQEFNDSFIVPDLLTTTKTQNSSLDFKVRGIAFETSAGDASMLFGVGALRQELDIFDESKSTFSSRVFGGSEFNDEFAYDAKSSRTPYFFNTELYLPLVGEKNVKSGIKQLALTGAYRYDNYDHFSGSSWAAGLIYSPTTWLDMVVNFTESFKAPNLADFALPVAFTLDSEFIFTDDLEDVVGLYNYIGITGGNPDLKAETAKSRSIGLRFTPESAPDFRAEINYSENEFNDQISTLDSIINLEITESIFSGIQSGELTHPTISLVDGELFQEFRASNVNDQRIRNLDAKVSYYRYTENVGTFGFRVLYNRTLENSFRLADSNLCNNACDLFSGSDEFVDRVEFVDTGLSSFAFPKHRGNIGFDWEYNGLRLDATYLYQSDTSRREFLTVDNLPLETIVTIHPVRPVNLQISYEFVRGSSWYNLPSGLDGARLILTIPNIFNDELTITRNPIVSNVAQGRLDSRASDPFGRVYTLRFQASF